jgi:uncharacterized protein (TIGR02147 family)
MPAMEPLFAYTDYRRFLADWFAHKKRANGHFSLRVLAEQSGFKARDYLMRVMRGERNLSDDGIHKLSEYFRFSEKQAEYFSALVRLNQARTHTEKERYYARLAEVRKYGTHQRLRQEQFEYLTAWYHSALRSLLPVLEPIPKAGDEVDWESLGKLLDPPLTGKQARDSVELLLRLGLLVRDAHGRYAVQEAALTTGDEVAALGVATFHRATMELAKRSIDKHPPDSRDISGVTMSISQEGFRRIKSELRAFRKRIQAIASADSGEDMVYQLNLHLFPLTRTRGKA